MGMPEYNEFADLARRAPNVCLDTTMVGTSYVEREFGPLPEGYLDTMVELSHKVVLGTDFPNIPYSYSHQIEALHNWGLGEEWIRNVLWYNPQRLLTNARVSRAQDRKSTRLNSSHVAISYAVFCLKKKKRTQNDT